jgi:glycosylphosphatidylinositol transamidase (GPIT) subunit GPI8
MDTDKLKQPIRLTADTRDVFFEQKKEYLNQDFFQQVRDSTKEDDE